MSAIEGLLFAVAFVLFVGVLTVKAKKAEAELKRLESERTRRKTKTADLAQTIRNAELEDLHRRFATGNLLTTSGEFVILSIRVSMTGRRETVQTLRVKGYTARAVYDVIESGALVVTTKRVFFAGQRGAQNLTKRWSQVTSWRLEDGQAVLEFTNGKPAIFRVDDSPDSPEASVILVAAARARSVATRAE
jgi:hypothetical protein